jgi:2-phosphosulfolactate phosphatase
VVIDVLRATSTAVRALAAGYARVVFAEDLDDALGLRGPGRVLAGERGCVRPPGFDQGNSPQEVTRCRGEELVLSSTNGAPAVIAAIRAAGAVLLASMLNLQATIDALAAAEGEIQIICAGAGGRASLEDVYVAGRLLAALDGERTDAARIAETVAAAYRTPAAALRTGAGGVALRAAGLGEDIAHCARESQLTLVAIAVADGRLAVAEKESQPGGAESESQPGGAARPCIASQTREGVHGMSM